jgi:hypothetical protein
MTDTQRRAVAAGFLHALSADPQLAQEWLSTPKDDSAAIGALIQKSMGLSQAPSSDDLHAMANYVESHLKSHAEAVQAVHPNAPRNVGFILLMQQNS